MPLIVISMKQSFIPGSRWHPGGLRSRYQANQRLGNDVAFLQLLEENKRLSDQLEAANSEASQLKIELEHSYEILRNHDSVLREKDGAILEARNLLDVELANREVMHMELDREHRLTAWYQAELAKKEMDLSRSSMSTRTGGMGSTMNSSSDSIYLSQRNKDLIMSVVRRWIGTSSKEMLQVSWGAWKELLVDRKVRKRNEELARKMRTAVARWGDRQGRVILMACWSALVEFMSAEKRRKVQEKVNDKHASDMYQLRLRTAMVMAGHKNSNIDSTRLKMLMSAWREFVVLSRKEREQFLETERLKEIHNRQIEQMRRRQAMHLQADGSRMRLLLLWTSWREYVQTSKRERALEREQQHKTDLQKQQLTRKVRFQLSPDMSALSLLQIIWSAWREFIQEARLASQRLREKREMIATQNRALDAQRKLRIEMLIKTSFVSEQQMGEMYVSMCFKGWREATRFLVAERVMSRSTSLSGIAQQRTKDDFERERKLRVLEASGMKAGVMEMISLWSNTVSPELQRSYLRPIWTCWMELIRISKNSRSRSFEVLHSKRRAGSVAQKRGKKKRRMWLCVSVFLCHLLLVDIVLVVGLTLLPDALLVLDGLFSGKLGLDDATSSIIPVLALGAAGCLILLALMISLCKYLKLKRLSVEQGRTISPQ